MPKVNVRFTFFMRAEIIYDINTKRISTTVFIKFGQPYNHS